MAKNISIEDLASELNLSTRLSDQLYLILHKAIISWQLKPGARLYQKKLADLFNVSQVTVRVALERLISEGLVIHDPYKGSRVISFSNKELIDIHEMRSLLEGHAMELATKKISLQDIEKMHAMLPFSVMDINSFPENVDNSRTVNREFHWIAINACDNQLLCHHLNLVWGKIDPYLMYNPWLHSKLTPDQLKETIKDDLNSHKKLVEALRTRDGGLAKEITHEMVDQSVKNYQLLMSLNNGQEFIQSVSSEIERNS
jgi:DNA-binding GntR family transcriptional regulator